MQRPRGKRDGLHPQNHRGGTRLEQGRMGECARQASTVRSGQGLMTAMGFEQTWQSQISL